jgi:hypothetical protein
MSAPTVPTTLGVAVPKPARGNLRLFAIVALVTVAVAWFTNEYVLTRAVYHRMLDAKLEASRVDAQFDFMQQVSMWGYLVAPVFLLLRLAIVAMTAQLFLLLAEDVPFRVVFRAACWASLAVCAASAARAGYLYLLPTDAITAASMQVVPSSLASLVMYPEDYRSPVYALLNLANVFEAAWCVILYHALRSGGGGRVGARPALVATAGTWTLLSMLQWAFSAYLAAAS